MDGGNRFLVVLGTPAKLPVTAADGPSAKADRRELKVRIAKSAKKRSANGMRTRRVHITNVDESNHVAAARIVPRETRKNVSAGSE